MQSILFLTFRTSATRSMLSIYQTLLPKDWTFVNATRLQWTGEIDQQAPFIAEQLTKENRFIYSNTPGIVSDLSGCLSNCRVILNARDPRDLICNIFYWRFQHPIAPNHPNKDKEDAILEKKKKALLDKGLDAFVVDTKNEFKRQIGSWFDNFASLTKQLKPVDWVFNSYALLCLQFDAFVANFHEFTGIDPDMGKIQSLDRFRSENLANNPRWIGNEWVGADIYPGRYKKELQPETINLLNDCFAEEIRYLTEHDHPLVRHTYL